MKPREVYVEFFGDPSDDKENYKRYCGTESFKPVGHDAEVIHFIEKEAYDKLMKASIKLRKSAEDECCCTGETGWKTKEEIKCYICDAIDLFDRSI